MLRLLAMQLRRDRLQLPMWIIGTGLMAFVSATAVASSFGTEAEREALIRVAVATPSLLALRGLPDGAEVGAYVFFQVFTYLALLAALMSTFLVVRHSRADEERGRSELVGAAPIRRTAPLTATLSLALAADAAIGVVVALALTAGGLAAPGSWLTGAAVATTGLAFVGLAALVAQLTPTSRSANGLAGGLVGVAFLLRAVGDALGTPDSTGLSIASGWPSWLSPIGWGQQSLPYTDADARPLLLSVVLAVASSGAALLIRSRRDIGASLLRERSGPAGAPTALRSNLALSWRLQRSTILWWALGGAVTGFFAGSVSGIAADGLGDDSPVADILRSFVPGGRGELIDLFVGAVLGIAGVLAAASGVQAVVRARSEEADGRAELVLAGTVSRRRWITDSVLIGVLSVLVVCSISGLAAALSLLRAGEGADRVWSTLATGLAQAPAALSFVAITVTVFAVLPRATAALGWSLLTLAFVIGQFGGLLDVPDVVHDLSPFTQTPGLPAAGADWTGAVVLLVVSAVLVVAASVLADRRGLSA